MRTPLFLVICLAVAALVFAGAVAVGNDYVFFAGYVILQYVVLSTAWNILGGYCGYVNFGSAAFFALGAYSTVAIYKLIGANDLPHIVPMPVLMLVGGVVSGVVGFGMGYLTLRLRGAFFAIATLALAVVLQTLIVNWDFVGGSRGAYILRPEEVPLIGSYIKYLFLVMLLLAVAALVIARLIERSRLGYGFATIRDDELAAEASGVPTLRLKLIATTISGALMGMAGAPFPYYIGYLQPSSAFGLDYAVNSIAMPLIGGTTSWVGPLIGAILLGTLQQIATVTISSAVNLLIVGVLLVVFVIVAPNGVIGLVHTYWQRKPEDFVGRRRVETDAPGSCQIGTMTNLLEVDDLGKRFGGFVALENISLTCPPASASASSARTARARARWSIASAARCRTSTAPCVSTAAPSTASPRISARACGLARSFQLPRPFASLSLLDNIRIPLLYTVASRGAGSSASDIEARCTDLLREVGLDQRHGNCRAT